MSSKFTAFFLALALCMTSCNDDDDNGGPSGNSPIRVEKSTLVLNGQSQQETASINAVYTDSPDYLDITSVFSDNLSTQLEMSPLRDEGSYSTSATLGFVVATGSELWFCNEGCTVVIEEHDTDDRWIEISVSGQMQDLFGTSSATLNSARVATFY